MQGHDKARLTERDAQGAAGKFGFGTPKPRECDLLRADLQRWRATRVVQA